MFFATIRPKTHSIWQTKDFAPRAVLFAAISVGLAAPAAGAIQFIGASPGNPGAVCTNFIGAIRLSDSTDCSGSLSSPDLLAIGVGSSAVIFDSNTGNSTFNALADFNSGITSDTISNSGTINTATLSAGTIIGSDVTASGSFRASPATTVDMGNNTIQFVGAGVADTDAVNVGQLNAAVAGVTTDVTAVEATTATHTTQIAELQTTVAGQTTDITEVQTGLATTNANVAENTADIATNAAHIATNTAAITANSADIVDLQSGLADTNAALGAVDTRVDALEAVTANLGERLDDLKDRSDAGTATAVALSGAMFLPGKAFNLTGNVGAYRGAIAGAVQFGAMVSRGAAVNAGIAKGFNRHGKTAVRAGFTLGW